MKTLQPPPIKPELMAVIEAEQGSCRELSKRELFALRAMGSGIGEQWRNGKVPMLSALDRARMDWLCYRFKKYGTHKQFQFLNNPNQRTT